MGFLDVSPHMALLELTVLYGQEGAPQEVLDVSPHMALLELTVLCGQEGAPQEVPCDHQL